MRVNSKRKKFKKLPQYILSAAVGLFVFVDIIPIIFTVITSFKTKSEYVYNAMRLPDVWTFQNYLKLFENYDVGRLFLNSLLVTAIPLFCCILFGAMAAFSIGKFQFKGRTLAKNAIFPLMSIPAVVLLFPLYRLFAKIGLTNHHASLMIIYVGYILPFILNMLSSFMDSVHNSFIEAAMIDGCGYFQAFTRVVLPLLAPALSATTIVGAMWLWNEMLLATVFVQKESLRTLTVGLTNMQGLFTLDVPLLMAGATITTAPVILIFVIGQKWLIKGLTAGGVK